MSLQDLDLISGETQNRINLLPFKDILLPEDFKQKYTKFVEEKKPDGYQSINWDRYTAHISTSKSKSIYLPNYWFFVAAQLAHLIDGLKEHRDVFLEIFNQPSDVHKDIAKSLRTENAVPSSYDKRINEFF